MQEAALLFFQFYDGQEEYPAIFNFTNFDDLLLIAGRKILMMVGKSEKITNVTSRPMDENGRNCKTDYP